MKPRQQAKPVGCELLGQGRSPETLLAGGDEPLGVRRAWAQRHVVEDAWSVLVLSPVLPGIKKELAVGETGVDHAPAGLALPVAGNSANQALGGT